MSIRDTIINRRFNYTIQLFNSYTINYYYFFLVNYKCNVKMMQKDLTENRMFRTERYNLFTF